MVEFSVDNVRKLAELVEKHSLSELTVEEDGLCITIKGRAPINGASGGNGSSSILLHTAPADPLMQRAEAAALLSASAHGGSASTSVTTPIRAGNLREIAAPMVGVFYRAPAPDVPSYVEVGDRIQEGQTIGLIEAMKVFSEIPSEFDGEVVEIPAQNGKLVQQGDILIVVRVAEE